MVFDGTALACKHSFKTNALGYCGPENAHSVFLEYLRSPTEENKALAQKKLEGFEALSPYLREIADANGLKPFDFDVVEAYWIGNKLLENVGREELRKIILDDFAKPGLLPEKKAKELAENVPEKVFAHHSFHVFYLNTVTGVIAKTVENADACRISWGKVIQVEESKATVEHTPLVSRGGFRQLGDKIRREVETRKEFTPSLEEGDVVSMHWNLAADRLSLEQKKNLERYTLRNLDAVNAGLR